MRQQSAREKKGGALFLKVAMPRSFQHFTGKAAIQIRLVKMGPGRTRDQEGTSTYHLFLFLPRTSQWNFEMKRKWLMASHGRQGLINSICISAVIRCSFTRRYWNILKHTHLNHCFFFGLTPTSHLLAPDADNPQPEVVYGFGHPLLDPLFKKMGWYLHCAVPALTATTCEQKNQRLTYPTWNCILEDAPDVK